MVDFDIKIYRSTVKAKKYVCNHREGRNLVTVSVATVTVATITTASVAIATF